MLQLIEHPRFCAHWLSHRLKLAIDGYVAALLGHRERQAAHHAVRHLGERELKDIGLYRGISFGRAAFPPEALASGAASPPPRQTRVPPRSDGTIVKKGRVRAIIRRAACRGRGQTA